MAKRRIKDRIHESRGMQGEGGQNQLFPGSGSSDGVQQTQRGGDEGKREGEKKLRDRNICRELDGEIGLRKGGGIW